MVSENAQDGKPTSGCAMKYPRGDNLLMFALWLPEEFHDSTELGVIISQADAMASWFQTDSPDLPRRGVNTIVIYNEAVIYV